MLSRDVSSYLRIHCIGGVLWHCGSPPFNSHRPVGICEYQNTPRCPADNPILGSGGGGMGHTPRETAVVSRPFSPSWPYWLLRTSLPQSAKAASEGLIGKRIGIVQNRPKRREKAGPRTKKTRQWGGLKVRREQRSQSLTYRQSSKGLISTE